MSDRTWARPSSLILAMLLFPTIVFARTGIVSDFAASPGFDWSTVVDAFSGLLASVVIPWAIMAYQRRTGVQITEQQRQAVYNALDTAKGLLETRIDQGRLAVHEVAHDHPEVIEAAQAALARVPNSAAAQGMTTEAAAAIIVGRMDTARPVPTP